MANTTETVFVEFVTDDKQLDSSVEKLKQTGKIDQQTADQFKKTNVELEKRQSLLNSTAASTANAATKAGASIDQVRKTVNNMLQDFVTGLQEGVSEEVQNIIKNIGKLKERVEAVNQGSPFERLTKDLAEARNRVLNITTAMEQLRRTGGVDTEQFVKLGELLVVRTNELNRLQETYDTVTDSVNRNKKANEENADSVGVLSSAQQAMAQKLLELKKRLEDTGKNTSFDKLNKSLSDARARVLNISASLAQLKRTGGVDTEQFKNLSAELTTSQAQLNKLQIEYDEVTSSVERNKEASENNSDAQATLRQRLSAVRQQMEQLKLAGHDTTEEYKLLEAESGRLKDAIGNVGLEINNAAADSKSLEGLIGVAQGITAGFAVAEGVTGLFGAKSEELNETLVKVTSTLALLQGFEQLLVVAKKESAAMTFLQTAGQKIYNVVIGESIGLMAAFRVALAATGVGLLIVGILALVQALDKVNKETEEANRTLERNKNILQADAEAIERVTNEQIARAEAVNQKESEIIKLRGHGFYLQQKAIIDANALLRVQRDALDNTSEAYFLLNKEIDKNNDLLKELDNKVILEKINLDKQLRTEQLQGIADTLQAQLDGARKNSKKEFELAKQVARAKAAIDLNEAGDNLQKRLAIEADLQKQIRALDLEFAKVRQQDRIAQTERALLNAQQRSRRINERTSQEEIDVQKQKIREVARLELLQEGLSANAKKLIIEKSIADQLQLQKDFNKQSNAEVLQDLISRNNAELSNIKLTNREREAIQEENLIAAAQIEIDANVGLADKIKEIRAKLNEDLRALRLAALEKQLADELSLEASRTGALRRASERIAADENKSLSKRIAAINQLAVLEIAGINTREDALKKELKDKLISQEDYNVKYAALVDEETKIVEDSEIKKRELTKATHKSNLLLALDTAKQVVDIIAQFGQQQTEAEQQRIDAQRQEVDDLRQAGAITEKEAIARNKKLDNEERALKIKQAQRDKSIALFQAIISTAAAIVKALPDLVLAGIAAALGAAQIALIASKPIPKFAKGKKDSYEGYGEIGEAGTELMQRESGDMYLAKKSAVVWIGKRDKVFNPKETIAMLEKNNMQPYIIKGNGNDYKSVYKTEIDYEKLGGVIAKNIPQVGLNVDERGFTQYTQYQNAMKTYLDNRRSYK